jgi:hypothetical protein
MTDPRPDLKNDSEGWTIFLTIAEKINLELAGTLHGMRCCGLRLIREAQSYSLRPEFNPETSKWNNQAEYMADRDKWLAPFGREIIGLLNQLEGA